LTTTDTLPASVVVVVGSGDLKGSGFKLRCVDSNSALTSKIVLGITTYVIFGYYLQQLDFYC
jgi:hypothetical protein